MRKLLTTKLPALLLAAWLLVSLTVPAWAADGEITISSVEDLTAFAEHCSLDTWSQGKTVHLTADLDLTGTDFTPIPTFGGTFLGDGHTISGLSLTASGSRQGLFRHIQPGGVVSDLKAAGSVLPGGSRSNVGGIAGVNEGTLQNCSFRGLVKGDAVVGGVVGWNRSTGQVSGCSMVGAVAGQSATGGVAGKNEGVLLKCRSSASVNTSEAPASLQLDDLSDLDPTVLGDWTAKNTGDDTDDLLNSHTDTGGIVGYSSGVVQSCTNIGTVGYPHVGYNVGGIAGRQTGYLSGCVNSGVVHGRKDVGGIAGQAEPYLVLDPGSDVLKRLRTELDTLDSLINRALDDADQTGDDLSARLTAMGQSTDSARDSSKRLLDHTADFIDGNVDSLNSLSASITGALDNMSPALDDLSDASNWMERLSGQLEDGLEELDIPESDKTSIRSAISRLRTAGSDLSAAADDLDDAVQALLDALVRNDDTAAAAALTQLSSAASDMGDGYRDAGTAVSALDDALADVPQLPDTGELDQLQQTLEDLADALEQVSAALPSTPEEWDALRSAISQMVTALGDALDAAGRMGQAAADLLQALDSAFVASGRLDRAIKDFRDAAASAAGMSRSLESAFSILSDVAQELSKDGPIEFATLGEETRAAGEDLYASLTDLSAKMQELNTSMQGSGDLLSADLRAISGQFNTVFDVLLDAMEDLQNGDATDLSDYIEDTSDEDIAATRLGKVADCRNTGAVDGDRNVGGILGSMAIEYDLDPEDDTARLSLGSTYETKAVLQACLNRGAVTAKKDCAGGLAGRVDLGTVVDSQNYGAVESTGGDYVGGVAGRSDGSIRACYAKCTLSGGNYVGGIAGWADRLTDSCSIATVTGGEEYVGAVAGDADLENGVIRNNCFVDTGTAAIDGVSYTGKAAPAAFADLRARKGIPAEFVSFTLTLTADGQVVDTIPFLYGDDLSLIDLPEVPKQEGSYGTWPDFDTSGLDSDITLEAVYTPWVTLVASGAQSGKLALALAEGRFTQDVVLQVTDSAVTPPEDAQANGTAVWDVTLTGTDLTDSDTVPLRLLNENGGRATVWQLTGDTWQQVDADSSGHYLLLNMTGTSGTFCICSHQRSILLPLLLVALLAAVLVLTAVLLVKRRKRKKAAANAPAKK